MQENKFPAVGVTNEAMRLVGLITPENVGEMMMVLAAKPARRRPGMPRLIPRTRIQAWAATIAGRAERDPRSHSKGLSQA